MARAAVFVDTAYLLALLNSSDHWHAAAIRWERALAVQRRPLVTTEFVILEVGDALSQARHRGQAIQAIEFLKTRPLVELVPASTLLIEQALTLFRARPDKDWGLTDCTSFVVMREHGLNDALTSDDHFRQAGYRVLLDSEPA